MTLSHKAALYRALVAVKPRGCALGANDWVEVEPGAIARARRLYDGGLVELATGRDAGSYYLYALPCARKAERPVGYTFREALGEKAYA